MDERPSVLYICHHGTKKMKWGVRLYQNKDGSLTPLGRIRYGKGGLRKTADDKASTKKAATKSDSGVNETPKNKSLSDMNDDELKSVINRLNLEKEYKQLIKEANPQKEHKVHKAIVEAASTSIKNIGTQTMTYAMGAAVNKVCRGVFNINYDVVNPRQGQSGSSTSATTTRRRP